MKQGFIKVAAATPKIRVADPVYNAEAICAQLKEAVGNGAKIIVFPELCLTGYTCGDLFWQEALLEGAKEALKTVMKATTGSDALVFVGLPLEKEGKLYITGDVFGTEKYRVVNSLEVLFAIAKKREIVANIDKKMTLKIENYKT